MRPLVNTAMLDSRENVGLRVRSVLDDAGLTQTDFAERAGCSRSFVSKVVRGEQYPSAHVLAYLAEEMGISSSWVLVGTGPRELVRTATGTHVHTLVEHRAELPEQVREALAVVEDSLRQGVLSGNHDELSRVVARIREQDHDGRLVALAASVLRGVLEGQTPYRGR